MAPAAANTIALSGEQVQLLCHMVTHCRPDNVAWNAIGGKMNISGSAAQQRFGRLLQKLKVNAVGGSGGSTTPAAKPKNANKKGGKGRKQHEEEEEEDESDDSDSPSKKRATVKNGIKRETAAGHALSDSDDGELKESFGLAAKTVEAESDEDED